MRFLIIILMTLTLPAALQAQDLLQSAGLSATADFVPPSIQKLNQQAYALLKPFREKVTYSVNPWSGRPISDGQGIIRAIADEEITPFTRQELMTISAAKLKLLEAFPNPAELQSWTMMWQQDISFEGFGYQNTDNYDKIASVMMSLFWDAEQSAHDFRRFTLKVLRVPDASRAQAILDRDWFVPPLVYTLSKDPKEPILVLTAGTEACIVSMTRHEMGFYEPKHISFRRLEELVEPPAAVTVIEAEPVPAEKALTDVQPTP